jgi:hypothetical protein
MRGKGMLLVGAVAGAIVATTPQGRKAVDDVVKKVQDLWASPDVQRNVSNAQDTIRTKVPFVGENIADVIGKTKPGL